MEQHTGLKPGQQLPILLEIVQESEGAADPVALGALGRDLIRDLKQDGYAVTPKNTGQRGGVDLLFQVMTQVPHVVQAIGADIYAQHDVLNIISDLCTIFVSVSPLAAHLFKAHEKADEKQAPKQIVQAQVQQQPIKITVMIDGAPITVEAADLTEAEAALTLARRFHAAHPTVKVTQKSEVKIRVAVRGKKGKH